MKYKFSYFQNQAEDPSEHFFNTRSERSEFIKSISTNTDVWILTSIRDKLPEEFHTDIFITDKPELILKLVRTVLKNEAHIHMQPYESYESAYAVALHMKEGHPKCYDND